MALPTSRSTTYAPGSQVKSADLNAIQDAIVSEHVARYPVPASLGVGGTPVGAQVELAPGEQLHVPIVLPVGARIASYGVWGFINTIGDSFEVRLLRKDPTAGNTQIGTTQTSPTTVGIHEVEQLSGVAEDVTEDFCWSITVEADSGNASDVVIKMAEYGRSR